MAPKIVRIIILVFCVLPITEGQGIENSQADLWMPANNGPYGAPVEALLTSLDNSLFAGAFGGGVFFSVDSGKNWLCKNRGLDPYVLTLAMNSQGILFAGTNSGVYRSDDKGENWISVGNELLGRQVSVLEINSLGYLYAGTFGGGILRSTDGGIHWFRLGNGLPDSIVTSILVDKSGGLWVAANNVYWQPRLYHSVDGGERWFLADSTQSMGQIYCLAESPEGSFFVGTYDAVFRSTDNGATWDLFGSGLESNSVLSLAFKEDGKIFAGTANRIRCSTDNGETWTSSDSGFVYCNGWNNVNAIAINHEGVVFAGSYKNGVYFSTDAGTSWSLPKTGLFDCDIRALLCDPVGFVYAATYLGRVFRSSNLGTTWSLLAEGFDGNQITSLDVGPDRYIFAGGGRSNGSGGIYRSSDKGILWDRMGEGVVENYVYGIVANPDGIVLAGCYIGGVYMSTNCGDTWTHAGLNGVSVTSVNIGEGNIFYAGTSGGLFFKSTNLGNSWIDISPIALPNGVGIHDIEITEENGIYVPVWGRGIYYSSDDGNDWTEMNLGLVGLEFYSILNVPNDGVYAGIFFYYGIFKQEKNNTWYRFDRGYPADGAIALEVTPSGYIFAASNNRGIFRKVHTATTAVEENQEAVVNRLSQNYPNPFNPRTRIGFRVSGMGDGLVTLKVFDVLGREVATLVNEKLDPGMYHRTFDGSELSSGVYFYRLQAGEFAETRKLLLLK